jgi:Na+/melibiose symporter-like transporter
MRLFFKSTEKSDMSLPHYMAYVAPSMALAFLMGPIGILQGIYAKYFGVALTTIAIVLLISRLFDAITDPIIGCWSDRHYAKTGTRKPFVVAGGLLFIISSYFLYVPVDITTLNADTTVNTTYFLLWFILFYLAWTLIEIPHLAWGAELATNTKVKNKLFSFRASSTLVGTLIFYLVPLMPFFPSDEFTPQTLQWTAISAGLLMLLALYYCLKVIPDGAAPNTGKANAHSVWELRYEILANKSFLIFIGAFCLYGLAGGMWITLLFIMVDTYLNLGHHFALITAFSLSLSIVSLGLWYWLANRFSKRLAWGLGVFCYASATGITGFLTPAQTGVLSLTAVMLLAYAGSASVLALSPSLLADIIDYGRWKFGTDHSATYFSLYTLVMKTAAAIGGSIGLGIAGGFGFEPSSTEHSAEAVVGLRLAASWLPTTVAVFAVCFMALVPLTTRHSHLIRCRLERRQSNPRKFHQVKQTQTHAFYTM